MKIIKFTTIKPEAFVDTEVAKKWQDRLEGRMMHKIGFHTILFPSLTLPKEYTGYGNWYLRVCNHEEVELESEHIFKYHCPKEMREILK